MIRILLLIGVIYLIYKGRKAWLSFKKSYQNEVSQNQEMRQIDDVMVQDPYCRVYLPRKDAVHVRHKGQDLYFCSEACKENYFHLK